MAKDILTITLTIKPVIRTSLWNILKARLLGGKAMAALLKQIEERMANVEIDDAS